MSTAATAAATRAWQSSLIVYPFHSETPCTHQRRRKVSTGSLSLSAFCGMVGELTTPPPIG